MSAFDDAVADMDVVLFGTDTFGDPGSYQRASGGAPFAVQVVVDQDVTPYLWEGVDVSDADVVLQIQVSEVGNAAVNDAVTIAAGVHAGTWQLRRRAAADAHVIRYFARKVA